MNYRVNFSRVRHYSKSELYLKENFLSHIFHYICRKHSNNLMKLNKIKQLLDEKEVVKLG